MLCKWERFFFFFKLSNWPNTVCMNVCDPLCLSSGVLASLQELGTRWDRMVLKKKVGDLYISEFQLCHKLQVKIY